MEKFNVIIDSFNESKFESYDVIPYFVREYKDIKNKSRRPKTFEEFKKFVQDWSLYRFWSRCEYEIVLKSWVSRTKDLKIDIHYQIMMNIDVITRLVMESLKIKQQ